jgi:multidrug efflux pump subunit AcrB
VALVVLVSLIGFWEWRSALLMALSIPITPGHDLRHDGHGRIDLQQVSIASLIIASGCCVDDPVVAGDAFKRLGSRTTSRPRSRLARADQVASAILYATDHQHRRLPAVPAARGDTGRFMYSLPIVIGASLVASRLVSMTFIPLLGYYLLRPKAEPHRGAAQVGLRLAVLPRRAVGDRAPLARRRGARAFLASAASSASSSSSSTSRRTSPTSSMWTCGCPRTRRSRTTARRREPRRSSARWRADKLESVTSFVGGGGPRFWSTVTPEQQQANYAQILVQVKDKHDTAHLIGPLQEALSSRVAGATIDVRELEAGAAWGSRSRSASRARTCPRCAAGRRACRTSARAARRAARARRLGRGELRGAARDRRRQGEHGGRHQPRRGRRVLDRA